MHTYARAHTQKARTDANLEGDTHGTGGPVPFITGIAEVELPIEYKLKNIEVVQMAWTDYVFGVKQGCRHYLWMRVMFSPILSYHKLHI